jgi:hypothetical protein
VKVKPTVGCPFSRAFPSDYIPKAMKVSVYISLFTAAVTVNYTSKFRKLFEATLYYNLMHLMFLVVL